jgi:hypothetical protein
MVASSRGSFQGENFREGSFEAIQEYFQRRSCRFCDQPFLADGVQLIREEPGVLVVKVGCISCGRPLGVALVGMNVNDTDIKCSNKVNSRNYCQKNDYAHPVEWSKKDIARLKDKPAITYDDVLSVHQFLDDIGASWSQHLSKVRQLDR